MRSKACTSLKQTHDTRRRPPWECNLQLWSHSQCMGSLNGHGAQLVVDPCPRKSLAEQASTIIGVTTLPMSRNFWEAWSFKSRASPQAGNATMGDGCRWLQMAGDHRSRRLGAGHMHWTGCSPNQEVSYHHRRTEQALGRWQG